GPYEIAIATDDPVRDPLVRTAWRLAPPGAVIVAGEPDRPGVPLLAGRHRRDGAATAYVCRGFVCDRPVTDPDELASQLACAGSPHAASWRRPDRQPIGWPPVDMRTGMPVVGMVGGGQLARMTHQAAIALGQSLRV